MKFTFESLSCLVVACCVVTSHCVRLGPSGLPTYVESRSVASNLTSSFNLTTRNDFNGHNETDDCLHSLTTDMWEKGNYSQLMEKMLRYGPAPHGWDRNQSHPIHMSALDVIRSHAQRAADYNCTPSDPTNAHCSAQGLANPYLCTTTADGTNKASAITMLKAVANYANRVVSLGAEVSETATRVAAREVELFDAFCRDFYRTVSKANVGQLGVSQGPFMALGAEMGAMPEIGGLLAAPFGLFMALNNPLTTQSWEPQFERSMEFHDVISTVSLTIKKGFSVAADNSINGVASAIKAKDLDNWAKDESNLPKVLRDKRFVTTASESISPDGISLIETVMLSAAVNFVWKHNKAFVVYATDESQGANGIPNLYHNLCIVPQHHPKAVIFPYHYFCDHKNSAIFLLATWYDSQDDNGQPKGSGLFGVHDKDGKTPWGKLSPEGYFRNSYAMFKVNNNNTDVLDKEAMQARVRQGIAGKRDYKAEVWNLPVCDTTMLRDTPWFIKKNGDYTGDVYDVFRQNVFCRCAQMPGWPYGTGRDSSPHPPGGRYVNCITNSPRSENLTEQA